MRVRQPDPAQPNRTQRSRGRVAGAKPELVAKAIFMAGWVIISCGCGPAADREATTEATARTQSAIVNGARDDTGPFLYPDTSLLVMTEGKSAFPAQRP